LNNKIVKETEGLKLSIIEKRIKEQAKLFPKLLDNFSNLVRNKNENKALDYVLFRSMLEMEKLPNQEAAAELVRTKDNEYKLSVRQFIVDEQTK
jgi:hypothetical protein